MKFVDEEKLLLSSSFVVGINDKHEKQIKKKRKHELKDYVKGKVQQKETSQTSSPTILWQTP